MKKNVTHKTEMQPKNKNIYTKHNTYKTQHVQKTKHVKTPCTKT